MRVRALIVALVIMACTGCATIPISGPVESKPRQSTDSGPGGITIIPEPPPNGASQTMIIRGFLTAMASFGSDYATAREYLTDEAASVWAPRESDVLIYASGTVPRVSGSQVTMSGSVIGSLRPDGSFVGSEEPVWNHDFGMVKEEGEWRISNPPKGLALSQYMFSQSFVRIDAYFFPASDQVLVPDPRYVQRGAWDITTAARIAVAGPSPWMREIIDTSSRQAIYLSDDVTLSGLGTAEIPLSDGAKDLDIEQATRLAIEIAATMRNIPGVERIRLLSNGNHLELNGASPDLSIPVGIADSYDVSGATRAQNIYMVQDGHIISLANGIPLPVDGEWGTATRNIQSFAVSQVTNQIAAVVDGGLYVGRIVDPPKHMLSEEGLLQPQFDSRGQLWVVAASAEHINLTMIRQDRQVSVDTSALETMRIRGFQIAPDGHRMILLREVELPSEGSRLELGIALISYRDGLPYSIGSWKSIRLTWEGSMFRSIIDMSWMGPSSLLVLGSPGGSPAGVFFTDIDGLGIEEWGLPQAWNPVQMAARATDTGPQIMVLDSEGRVWSYQDGYHWSHPIVTPITSIAFPA